MKQRVIHMAYLLSHDWNNFRDRMRSWIAKMTESYHLCGNSDAGKCRVFQCLSCVSSLTNLRCIYIANIPSSCACAARSALSVCYGYRYSATKRNAAAFSATLATNLKGDFLGTIYFVQGLKHKWRGQLLTVDGFRALPRWTPSEPSVASEACYSQWQMTSKRRRGHCARSMRR